MLPIPGMEAHRERDKGRDIFARLYEVHAPSLLSFVGLRVATREDARDLLVEVFLAALEDKRFIQLDEAQQRSWLWKVTRNKVTDYYRKRQHQHISSLEEYTGDLYTDESDEPEVMAILSDGDTAYINAFNDTTGQSHLIAIDATTGKERWDVPLKIRIEGNLKDGTLINLSIITTPVVSNGQVFVINRAGTVFAFDSKTGKQNWAYDTGASVYVQTYFKNPDTGKMQSTGSPTLYSSITPIVNNGILYGAQRDTVYALDATSGHKIWTYKITLGQQFFEDAQVVDGVLYAASNAASTHQEQKNYQSIIYALDATNGTLNWNYEINGYDLSSLAIDNGHIYFIKNNTSDQSSLAALNQQGHELWEHTFNTSLYWLTAGNGYVSISGFNHDQSNVTKNQSNLITNALYVLDANGHPIWQNTNGADGISINNGVLYTIHGLWVIAYDLKTQKELWRGQYGIDILDRAGNHTAHLGFMNVVP